ncbi:MAG: hypothetical protein VYE22_01115 [Myxococcota bacterium]|nr:hypothetical protein [Myxococcota bacterium]
MDAELVGALIGAITLVLVTVLGCYATLRAARLSVEGQHRQVLNEELRSRYGAILTDLRRLLRAVSGRGRGSGPSLEEALQEARELAARIERLSQYHSGDPTLALYLEDCYDLLDEVMRQAHREEPSSESAYLIGELESSTRALRARRMGSR